MKWRRHTIGPIVKAAVETLRGPGHGDFGSSFGSDSRRSVIWAFTALKISSIAWGSDSWCGPCDEVPRRAKRACDDTSAKEATTATPSYAGNVNEAGAPVR
jgi:hypothetical protein